MSELKLTGVELTLSLIELIKYGTNCLTKQKSSVVWRYSKLKFTIDIKNDFALCKTQILNLGD